MNLWFALIFSGVISQRLLELRLAKRNAIRIRGIGGYEIGADHYKYLVLLHAAFFLSLLTEFSLRRPFFSLWMLVPSAIFILLQAARIWCIRSLGIHWNTRIFIVPGAPLVRRGPYRFLRHPNYAVVTLELLFLPLIFGCYWSAALFPVLNMIVLKRRISLEEQALLSMSTAAE
ncbi:isoprenylcysteine carboxyl methyltransferase family protein [Paenibacillus alkalitolerans]|uniref:isoprenylcysteine carboxyl methyltransferase family protein n=1 Tax=Paenibacillus alkalitolerans TaxID=2799335 RepID=UPI0018F42423|nr:isoprenylcysteine carboxylmethyltransferase family protein [Paenibacillus alkalitolerans]